MYDVIIVGGGPAGLSAALVLGRCRRRVLLCDSGQPRNAAAQALHGYLTRDGIAPDELRALGRAELERYGVEVRPGEVVDARALAADEHPEGAAFEVTLAGGHCEAARKLLLATGVQDILPDIEGTRQYYGRGVHHCPYCDGWEYRERPLVAYGRGDAGVGLARSLLTWSDDVTLCTDGEPLADEVHEALARDGVKVRQETVLRLEGTEPPAARLERVVTGGGAITCRAFFFTTGQMQHSQLPALLGCAYRDRGNVSTRASQGTGVSGLYLAGDADGDVQFVIVAAAEGATAAVAINKELQKEDLARRMHDAGA